VASTAVRSTRSRYHSRIGGDPCGKATGITLGPSCPLLSVRPYMLQASGIAQVRVLADKPRARSTPGTPSHWESARPSWWPMPACRIPSRQHRPGITRGGSPAVPGPINTDRASISGYRQPLQARGWRSLSGRAWRSASSPLRNQWKPAQQRPGQRRPGPRSIICERAPGGLPGWAAVLWARWPERCALGKQMSRVHEGLWLKCGPHARGRALGSLVSLPDLHAV